MPKQGGGALGPSAEHAAFEPPQFMSDEASAHGGVAKRSAAGASPESAISAATATPRDIASTDASPHDGDSPHHGRGAAQFDFSVKRHMEGKRLDQYLVDRFPNYSRALIQKVIQADAVTVNGRDAKPSYPVKKEDHIRVWLPELVDDVPVAEDIPLDVLYEDEFMVVVNKPPGMVVHPAKGHWRGTLVNALQHRFQQLSQVAGQHRPGIVHRLDRDTSGCIVVAKDDMAHANLAGQFEARTVEKEYWAIVAGEMDRDSDYVERPLGPHPTHREKMAIRAESDGGKEASSYYEVLERFRDFTLVKIIPKTGRTHQIRVHLAHVGGPILADFAYGGRRDLRLSDLTTVADGADRTLIQRQALHARRLRLRHPRIRETIEFEAPLPDDFMQTLEAMRRHRPYR